MDMDMLYMFGGMAGAITAVIVLGSWIAKGAKKAFSLLKPIGDELKVVESKIEMANAATSGTAISPTRQTNCLGRKRRLRRTSRAYQRACAAEAGRGQATPSPGRWAQTAPIPSSRFRAAGAGSKAAPAGCRLPTRKRHRLRGYISGDAV